MTLLDRKVLQVLGRSAGGIARHVADITRDLDGNDGLRLEVAGPGDLPLPMPGNMHEVSIPDGPIIGHRGAVKRLRSIMSTTRCDVVHAHGLRAGIDAALAAKRLGVPVFLTVHNLVHPDVAGRWKAPIYRKAEGLAVRLTNHVFCVSEQIARHLRSSVPGSAEKIEVLYLGSGEPPAIDRSRDDIRREAGIMHPDERLIVTASRLAPQKALHILLQAIVGLPEVRLAVLGEGPLGSELKAMAADLGIEGRTRFLGFRSDASGFIAAADVFCLSSIWEGIPLAAQEAILLDTPIVATDVGGMNELITDRRSGRLCPPDDVEALRSALSDVLSSSETARAYAVQAQTDLEHRFSRPRMLERLTSAYKEDGRVP